MKKPEVPKGLLTTDEVMARLQVKRTWFDGFLKFHPRLTFCLVGRSKRFTEAQYNAIVEAMQRPSPHVVPIRPIGGVIEYWETGGGRRIKVRKTRKTGLRAPSQRQPRKEPPQ